MSALVQVNSANRTYAGAIVCSLNLLGKDYVVTFRYQGGHLTPDCFFDQELFSIGLTMAHIEPAVLQALRQGVHSCPVTEDDLYDTVDAIERRQWAKWCAAARNEPRWF